MKFLTNFLERLRQKQEAARQQRIAEVKAKMTPEGRQRIIDLLREVDKNSKK